jgi:hypothetical protein
MYKHRKEKLINRMIRSIWNRNGGQSTHGMTFKNADIGDSFGYRETATMIINATLRAEKRFRTGR